MTDATQELVDAGLTPREARATAPTETGPAPEQEPPALAEGYLRTLSPITKTPVVFLPGERLPAWAVEAQEAQKLGRSLARAERAAAEEA